MKTIEDMVMGCHVFNTSNLIGYFELSISQGVIRITFFCNLSEQPFKIRSG